MSDAYLDEALIKSEEISALNLAVSRLSAVHREVIIEHYLRGRTVGEIAASLGIPAGTVKRRLHDARVDLKRSVDSMETTGRFSYAPMDLQLSGCLGAPNYWNSISDLMTKQILSVCAWKAKSIREIADEIGVAPVYFEEKLRYLLDTRIIKETARGKYITDFVILPAQLKLDFNYELSLIWGDISADLTELIKSAEKELRAPDYYGNDMPHEYLLWLWYVYACDMLSREMTAINRNRYPDVPQGNGKDYRFRGVLTMPDEVLTPRPVKTVGWSNMHYHFKTAAYSHVTFANLYEYEPFADRDHMINESNIGLVMRLYEDPETPLTKVEETQAAELIADGFAEKEGTGIRLMLPVMSYSVKKQLEDILRGKIGGLALRYTPAIGELADRMILPHIREDLMEEYVNDTMNIAFWPLNFVMHYAQHTPTLEIPEDYRRSAAGCAIYFNK